MGVRVGKYESIIATSAFLGDCTGIGAGIWREYFFFASGIRYEVTFIGRQTQAAILGVVEGRKIAFEDGSGSQFIGEALASRAADWIWELLALASSDMEIRSRTIGDQPWWLEMV